MKSFIEKYVPWFISLAVTITLFLSTRLLNRIDRIEAELNNVKIAIAEIKKNSEWLEKIRKGVANNGADGFSSCDFANGEVGVEVGALGRNPRRFARARDFNKEN